MEEQNGFLNANAHKLTGYLKEMIYALAGDIGERNTRRYDQLVHAREFLIRALRDSGFRPRLQTYNVDGRDCSNIEVEQTGAEIPDNISVVGAHYDSVGGSPGANDNASGVAGVLALASFMKTFYLKKTIRFLLFVNEEPPYTRTSNMGSLVYARDCFRLNEQIEAMISLEEIGYFPSDGKQATVEPWLYRLVSPSNKQFISFVGNRSSRALVKTMARVFQQETEFPVKHLALPGFFPGIRSSDHWAFWKQGYPAVMVTDTAWARYPFYHTGEDTPEKLDYGKMAQLLKGLGNMLVRLCHPC